MTRALPQVVTRGVASAGFITEFIGLPGVGKTTLALEVLDLLTPDLPVTLAHSRMRNRRWLVRRLYSGRSIVGLAGVHPHYALHAGQVIRASGQRSVYDTLKVTHNWLSVSAETVRAQRVPGVCLFDQGMFQALWSVGYSARGRNKHEQLQRLADAMPKPQLLVLLSAELPTVLRRLRARGGQASRLDVNVDAGAATRLPEAAELLAHVTELARDSQEVRLLELDCTRDYELGSNAQYVAATIRAALGPVQLANPW